MAGPSTRDFEGDPLAAWFKAGITLLEHGPARWFRSGWRKSYVEFLDASVVSLLAAIAEVGDRVPVVEIEENAWQQVAAAYGYQVADNEERRHVVRLVGAMANQLADIGVRRAMTTRCSSPASGPPRGGGIPSRPWRARR